MTDNGRSVFKSLMHPKFVFNSVNPALNERSSKYHSIIFCEQLFYTLCLLLDPFITLAHSQLYPKGASEILLEYNTYTITFCFFALYHDLP